MKKMWFLTYILLYLRNDTRYGHSYYGISIGTRCEPMKQCQFQWTWMTLIHISRSHHYLMLNISERVRHKRHSCNEIGTYTCPTQGYHFKWPQVILSVLAKYSMTQNTAQLLCYSRASCKIWHQLFWINLPQKQCKYFPLHISNVSRLPPEMWNWCCSDDCLSELSNCNL